MCSTYTIGTGRAGFRIRIRTDLLKDMPPLSGSAWTDADPNPDPGGKEA